MTQTGNRDRGETPPSNFLPSWSRMAARRERAVTHFEGDRSNGAAALRRELSGYPYPGFMRAAGLLWATGMAGTSGEWDSAAYGSSWRT